MKILKIRKVYMIKKIMMFLIVGSTVFALKVSPPVMEDTFEGREIFREITVTNDTSSVKRYEVGIEKPEDTTDDSYYLGDTMKVFPRVVSIKPGESKKVRVLIEDSPEYTDGEYRAYVTLEEMQGPQSEGVNFQMNMRSSVYAIKGELRESGKIEGERIVNTGNSSLRLLAKSGEEVSNVFIPRGGSIPVKSVEDGAVLINRRTEKEIHID